MFWFNLQQHKQALESHWCPTDLEWGSNFQEPDVGLKWPHGVRFLNTFPPVFTATLLYLTELPDPSKVLIFFVCSLTPLLCLFCSLQEEVLSPGFSPCVPTLHVTGETVSLWSRSWISRDGLGHRSLNLGFRVPTKNTCSEWEYFLFMPIFTSTTGKYVNIVHFTPLNSSDSFIY